MSTEQSTKNLGVALFYISIDATSNIARALRQCLTAVKYSFQEYGEDHYKNYLKETKGHRFKNWIDFAHYTFDKKESDVTRMPVTKKDRDIIEKLTKRMGIDYCLMKRPPDLDSLIQRKFENGETLSSEEEKLVNSFIQRNDKGEVLMNPENPKMPLVKDAEYVLVIAEKDLPKWEIICRELEVLSHTPTLGDRLKNSKIINYINEKHKAKMREKQQQHTKPTQERSK